jgi:hypothetical protein
MTAISEFWIASPTEAYLYTESEKVANELLADFRAPTCYYRGNGSLFAWQFLIPNRLLPLLRRKFLPNESALVETTKPSNNLGGHQKQMMTVGAEH